MKKIIALVLVMAISLSLCACGKSQAVQDVEALISAIGEVSLDSKEAIDAAQQAYDALSAEEKAQVANLSLLLDGQNAYQELEKLEAENLISSNATTAYISIVRAWVFADQMGNDLYNIWHGCVWKEDELSEQGIQFFVDNTSLTEEEVITGLAARNYINAEYSKTGVKWNDLSAADQERYKTAIVSLFDQAARSRQVPDTTDALYGVVNAFMLNGDMYDAQDALETAKQAIKALPEDYQYYNELKGFYTTTSSLVDFCSGPSGSFNQYQTLLNDYRKDARTYQNDLDFVFGE